MRLLTENTTPSNHKLSIWKTTLKNRNEYNTYPQVYQIWKNKTSLDYKVIKLREFQKFKTNPITFHEELLSIKDADAEHLFTYTDGSKDDGKVVYAGVRKKLELIQPYPDKASILSAKVTGIHDTRHHKFK